MPGGLSTAATVAAVIIATLPVGRAHVAVLTILASAISLLATAGDAAGGTWRSDSALLLETVAILALLFLTFRGAPIRVAVPVGVVAAVAGLAMIPFPPQPTTLEKVGAVTFWLLFALIAVGAALYLNWLDAGREAAVVAARRTQRLELARDLHDFVAHDVSAIVVQAQAAQVVARADPDQALASLRRIEEAGLHALASMDRTVHALREVDAPDGEPDPPGAERRRYGLDDLRTLVDRFAASGSSAVDLEIDPALADGIDPEVDATCYRVAVEALTNIRRHAPDGGPVRISAVRRAGPGTDSIELTVVNDAAARGGRELRRDERAGGLGLAGLRERVEALGGRFGAGPNGSAGWEVRATLPVRRRPGGAAP